MSILQSLILGIIQGLTEFFPISSSSHLRLAKFFLGIDDQTHLFDLSCHLGTLLVAILFLRKDILNLFLKERQKIIYIFLALLPLIPAYVLIKPFRFWVQSISFIGVFLLITSCFLFLGAWIRPKAHLQTPSSSNASKKRRFWDYLFIGSMQSLALFPGISRSGSTISAACMRGWSLEEAVRFSFLLAIPTMLGGMLLELLSMMTSSASSTIDLTLPPFLYLVGFFSAFFSGFIGAKCIFSLKNKKVLFIFAWYCLLLGICSLVYFSF